MRTPWVVGLLAGVAAGAASAGTITTYFDRPSFEGAAPLLTVEDFTDGAHFPISTGVLNSETNLPDIGLLPGMIEAGVTYSTEVGQFHFFNIDAGGGYTGGFLDGFEPSNREVKVAFHLDNPDVARNVYAFGFDLGTLPGATDFDVKVTFADKSEQDFNFPYPESLSFFGFLSDEQDISSVLIGNNGGFYGFDFDNFTFDTVRGGCTPDLDGNGVLDLFDFLAYVNLFNSGDMQADFDGNGVLDLFDFLAFVNAFNAGC